MGAAVQPPFRAFPCKARTLGSRITNLTKESQMRGTGRVAFAAILLLVVGTINIIYGIGALDDARIFVNDTRFILDDLNTLGWVLIILGVLQITAGLSLASGRTYGRVFAI